MLFQSTFCDSSSDRSTTCLLQQLWEYRSLWKKVETTCHLGAQRSPHQGHWHSAPIQCLSLRPIHTHTFSKTEFTTVFDSASSHHGYKHKRSTTGYLCTIVSYTFTYFRQFPIFSFPFSLLSFFVAPTENRSPG